MQKTAQKFSNKYITGRLVNQSFKKDFKNQKIKIVMSFGQGK